MFCWIHDEGIHYSQFHTADGSIHLEVDGYGFKRFDCSETFADVQRFIKILKHATANQLSWCDAEKTFKLHERIEETKSLEKEMDAFTTDQLIKQRDDALQQLQIVTSSRDEATKQVEQLKQYALKLDDWNDKLQAEVDRLKADKERLDWLDSFNNTVTIQCEDGGIWIEIEDYKKVNNEPEKSLRDAIDAAMKGDV